MAKRRGRNATPVGRTPGGRTPAVQAAEAAGIDFRLHEYPHDPRAGSYGLEAAEALGQDPLRVFKTLVVALDADPGRLAVGVVPVACELDLKALAGALGSRRAVMAEVPRAERATGYVAGGISPLGQRSRLPLVLDASATAHASICVSGGRRGLEIELTASDLLRLTEGRLAAIARGV